MIASLERPAGPAPSPRQVLADFGPIYAANGFIGFVFAPPTAGLLLDHSGHGPRWSIPAAPVLSRGHWRLLRHKCSDLGLGGIWFRQARDDGRAHADRHGHGGRSVPALWPGSGPCPTQRCCDRRPDGPDLSPPLGGTGARSPYAAADRRAAGWGTGYHRPWPDRCISTGQLPTCAAGRACTGMVVGGHDRTRGATRHHRTG